MPTVGIKRDALFEALGRTYTEKEFDQLCFDFGIELDEVTSEKEQVAKEQGDAKATGLSEEVIYKLDIPANRHDLLCLEGIVYNLKIFIGQHRAPKMTLKEPENGMRQKLIVKSATQDVRPTVVCAVLRNVNMNQSVYNSFIDLQDKLHQNIGRRRTLVSIGTHDLDTIQGPFVYDAKAPADISFVALSQTKEHTAAELLELYKDSHLKPYLQIIKGPKHPVITDSNGVIMSIPPIINGNHSKITLKTRNIFIEITATDKKKANVALDTIVCNFSSHCDVPFQIEPVDVELVDGTTLVTPALPYRKEKVYVDYLNKKIGIDITADRVAEILTKMCLESEVTDASTGEITVTIPPTRSDILHSCDIVEDVAIAYGYDNIKKTLPRSMTIGSQQLAMKLTERLRVEVACNGFTEVLAFHLCMLNDCGSRMMISDEQVDRDAVKISNPATLEFQIVRTSLIPGLLKTLNSNRNLPVPLKIFEVQEICLKDAKSETGAINQRHLGAVVCDKNSGFEVIHGLVDAVMRVLEYKWTPSDVPCPVGDYYRIRSAEDPSYFPGRCGEIVINNEVVVGKLGVLHPQVVSNFGLSNVVSAVEINLEKFYKPVSVTA